MSEQPEMSHPTAEVVVEHMQVGLLVFQIEADRILLAEANPAASKLLATDLERLVGSDLRYTLPSFASAQIDEVLSMVAETGDVTTVDIDMALAGGDDAVFLLRLFPLPGNRVAAVFDEVTAQRKAEIALRHRALHDELTGIPNRAMFVEQLHTACEDAERNEGAVGVFAFDLNGFKAINDTFGHRTGDRLLMAISERVSGLLRGGDTFARTGGDEFSIVVKANRDIEGVRRVADRLAKAFREPFLVEGRSLRCGASIGVATLPGDGHRPDVLAQRADHTMYEAKRSGIPVAWWRDSHGALGEAQLEAFHDALVSGRIDLADEPIVDATTGAVVATHLTPQWALDDGDVVLEFDAEELATLASRTGLIPDLSRYVISRAASFLRHQLDSDGVAAVRVDLPHGALHESELITWIADQRRVHQLPVGSLTVAVDEASVADHPGLVMPALQRCQEFGLGVAITDVAGCLPLTAFHTGAVDEIEFAASVTRAASIDVADRSLAETLASIAAKRSITLTGCDVVDHAEAVALASLGCHHLRGSNFAGRPEEATDSVVAALEFRAG